MKINGSCHCGNISYEADGEFGDLLACNCSICSKRGYLLWFVPRSQVKLADPAVPMNTYTFNRHKIKHHFCPTCGCAPFGIGADDEGNETVAINARCVNDVDLAKFKHNPYDGKSV